MEETSHAARGHGLQIGIWESEENMCAWKNDMRKISAGVPLSCPSFGPPVLAGLKTVIAVGNTLQIWGSNLPSFGCPQGNTGLRKSALNLCRQVPRAAPQDSELTASRPFNGMKESLMCQNPHSPMAAVGYNNLCLFTTSLTDLLYAQTMVAIFVIFCVVSRDSVREKKNFLLLRVPVQPRELNSFRTQQANLKNQEFVIFNTSW